MSINASFFVQVVPAGPGPKVGTLRAAIVLLPRQLKAGWPAISLADWPSGAHRAQDTLTRAVRALRKTGAAWDQGVEEEWAIEPTGRSPNEFMGRLDALWRRIMTGGTGGDGVWEETLSVWEAKPDPAPPERRAAVLPLPTAEAGIAIPLERGRAVLDTLAAPDSPILAHVPTRPPAYALAALGRPWLGQPDTATRFAARHANILSDRDRDRLFGPPNIGEWLGARTSGDSTARRAGDLAYARPLDPEALTRDALGMDGRDMLDVFDRMHALHHAAVEGLSDGAAPAGPPAPPPSSQATRRVAQLMASPSLLRLFGFVRDVLLCPPAMPAGASYWCLRIPPFEEKAEGTAAKLDVGTAVNGFYPVPRAEWDKGGPSPTAGLEVLERDGVVVLGGRRITGPDHAVITLEPALAIESDRNAQALTAGTQEEQPASDPLTAGLALVRLGVSEPLPKLEESIRCSEELRTFDRLDIGLVVQDGRDGMTRIEWRCAQHRKITWSDPGLGSAPPAARRASAGHGGNYIEAALAVIGTGGLARHELDAASCTPADIYPRRHDKDEVLVCYRDQRIGIYDGYPGGAATNAPVWDKHRPGWTQKDVEVTFERGLALNQTITVPDVQQDGPRAAAIPLRIRGEYRMGMRRVWLGGITRPLEEAARLYETVRDAPVPPLDKPGRPYLRHEAVAAPLVLLPHSVPIAGPNAMHEDTLQTAEQAVVLTWPGTPPERHKALRSTARVLLVPPVSLEFASLHEVFDARPHVRDAKIQLTEPKPPRPAPPKNEPAPPLPPPVPDTIRPLKIKAPRDMLRRLKLEGEVKQHDSSMPDANSAREGAMPRLHVLPLGIEHDRPAPYYPDPAAAYLVVGLREASGEAWVEAPQLVRLRGGSRELSQHPWPDVLPVHVEVEAAGRGVRSLSVEPAPAWLALPNATHVRSVRVRLGPGEEVILEAWLLPSLEDLASWFDVCDSAARLATVAGGGNCRDGLNKLLGATACAGLTPTTGRDPAEARREVASLLWARLGQGPVEAVAKVRRITLLHARRDASSVPTPVPEVPFSLARRVDTSDAAVETFLATGPGAEPDQDGAVQPILRGDVLIDLATTAGILVEAEIAAPDRVLDQGAPAASPNLVPLSARPLNVSDGPDGELSFSALVRRVELLRITGIPAPTHGSARDARVSLGNLQRQAALRATPGLTAVRGTPLVDGGARRVRLRVTALPRHAATTLRPDETDAPGQVLAVSEPIWLNATIRPAAPDPKELVPTFVWNGGRPTVVPGRALVWTRTREVGLRLTLRRPWFTAGEGEELGIILWPPAALGPEPRVPITLDEGTLGRLIESDIGPLGPFVSAWARDPLRDPEPGGFPTYFPLERAHFAASDRGADAWRDVVLVPIAGGDLNRGLTEEATASILRIVPRYDRATDVWTADIPFAPEAVRHLTDRFVRLGLVRWQEHARPDRRTGAGPRGIRCSEPASVWTVMPPARKVIVTALEDGGRSTLLTVQLSGPGDTLRRQAPAPTVSVSITVLDTRGAREIVAQGEHGDLLQAETPMDSGTSEDKPVIAGRNGADRTWTAAFRVPVKRAALLGHYAVVVEESDAMPAADDLDKSPQHPLRKAGTRFFSRVDLVAE
ncbi:hypothetical protein E0493_19985 [Roseomonas sp. M0104]|uniref:Uncharacterized protein n=1 Tax=Teichococcus coralli TaxID=2545983 RepID=A0A845BDH1_9PROT|nr:hypothetical protein [Pseudoroseomonas coralli]MXP65633.1 hypothetical protein [Pseudoroseomonas coralli]